MALFAILFVCCNKHDVYIQNKLVIVKLSYIDPYAGDGILKPLQRMYVSLLIFPLACRERTIGMSNADEVSTWTSSFFKASSSTNEKCDDFVQ